MTRLRDQVDDGRGAVISGTDARGGRTVLRSRRRRAVFLSGLLGFVLLAAILTLIGIGVF